MLANQACAVFGFASTRSLAWGIASAWAAAGADVTVGIQSERFRGALERAGAAWARPPHVVVADAADDASVAAAVAAAGARAPGGRLAALAHSIAWAPAAALRAPLLETSRADFAAAHDVSAYSLVAFARAGAPLLAGGGVLLALSYVGAARAARTYRVMGPAKASLEATARALALELGPRGVRVNVISAGPVDTLAARGIESFGVRGARARVGRGERARARARSRPLSPSPGAPRERRGARAARARRHGGRGGRARHLPRVGGRVGHHGADALRRRRLFERALSGRARSPNFLKIAPSPRLTTKP